MEKQPKFIKDFSKEQSKDERNFAAFEISQKRKENFAVKEKMSARESEIKEKLAVIDALKEQLKDLSENGVKRLLNYFKIKNLRSELQGENFALDTAKREIVLPPDMEAPKKILDKFYDEQKRKWSRAEYSKEDIQEYFSEEHLASLSIEEYTLLLERFPSEMVAHVTRQGIRDHVGHFYHTAGQGEYANGFTRILEDGRLRSPLGVQLVENEKERALVEYLHLESYESREEALKEIRFITEEKAGDSGGYTDKMAIHFATEEVADCYYGSEKGNEIFIAYPSAYVASQYYFSGQLNQDGGGYWNDQWVWANEEKGMDINAGVIFIPEETRVSRENGSRYEIDSSGNPIANIELQTTIRRVVDAPDFLEFADEVKAISGKKTGDSYSPVLEEKLKPYREKLERAFGINEKRLQDAIFDYNNLCSFAIRKEEEARGEEPGFFNMKKSIESALQGEGIFFREADDNITAKEFWEAYFNNNPSVRPSKVVYYKGSSPTAALWKWKRENGLNKKANDKQIGFPERSINRDDPRATAGVGRFKELAENVINNYFDNLEGGV
ncbi:MAG: hypothetical protein ACD_5C00035G0001 [uncultured bacterium]|nr:MAG: hypothetical protein ACD_5C00035G0001 [uncultured bacterium]